MWGGEYEVKQSKKVREKYRNRNNKRRYGQVQTNYCNSCVRTKIKFVKKFWIPLSSWTHFHWDSRPCLKAKSISNRILKIILAWKIKKIFTNKIFDASDLQLCRNSVGSLNCLHICLSPQNCFAKILSYWRKNHLK